MKDLTLQSQRWHNYLWEKSQIQIDDSRNPDFPEWAREQFSRLYSMYVKDLPEDQHVPWAKKLNEAAFELPEWQSLRRTCQGDLAMSAVAAQALAEKLAESLPDDPPPPDHQLIEQQIRGLEDLGLDVPDDLRQMLAEAKQKAQEYASKINESTCRQAIRRACDEARQDCERIAALSRGFGPGDMSPQDPSAVLGAWKKLRRNKRMIAIIELTGKMARKALRKQRAKHERQASEVTDVEMGRDLARVLPAEFVKLRHPLMRRAFLRAYVEGGLLQYRLDDRQPEVRGPIVVCVDKSGSMSGEPEIWSKAIALTMAEIALFQKRAIAILLFDSQVRHKFLWRSGERPELKEVIKMLSVSADGGTDFDKPLTEAVSIIEKDTAFGKADVVFITDGRSSVDSTTINALRQIATKQGLTVYGVQVSGSSECLRTFCDEIFEADLAKAEDRLFDV